MFGRHPLGLFERIDLRQHLRTQLDSGRLPGEAEPILTVHDAFDALQVKVATLRSSSPSTAIGQPGHPLLHWLVQHAPQIEAFVQEILSLFGIHIVLPPLPGPPPPAPAPSPSPPPPTPAPSPPPVVPPPFNPPVGAEPVGFALPPIPPFVQQLLLSWMIGAIQKIGPEIAANIPAAEAWLEDKLKKTFGG